ncbi:MAG TPA: SUMF1/EgtB/PvdO family nonheme iron enzyme [Polyangiaceae bacterium]|nr:SUMF1/EgtB/PvdO family nonheme iron enzyme [Polyangiaceae bacterium]
MPRALPSLNGPVAKPTPPAPKAPCSDGMVLVGSFCIDRYEAHLLLADGSGVHPANHPLASGVEYRAASGAGVLPQGYISRDEASAACQAAGKRLCKAREWQAACKGAAGHKYPYGVDEVKGRCNTGKVHLPSQLFGPFVTRYGEQHLNHPRLNLEPGFLAKTGEYADCASDQGVFDMVGNLHEWVADDSNGALPKKIPIPYGAHRMGQRGNGVFMGGYFSSQREHGRGCEYVTTHHAPGYHDYSTGFRCCSEPGDTDR